MIAWSKCGDFRCEKAPVIDFSADLAQCRNMPHGGQCYPQCLPGFEGGSSVVCKYGKWEGGTPCVFANCTVPQINHALSLPKTIGQQSLTFDCEDGYAASGHLICDLGTINHPECLPKSCEKPPLIAHALSTNCENIPSGFPCNLTCSQDYYKTGDPVCVHGSWNGTQVKCVFGIFEDVRP